MLATGSDRIPVELFQILKDDAVESAALNMQYAICTQYAICQLPAVDLNGSSEVSPSCPQNLWTTEGLASEQPQGDTGALVSSPGLAKGLYRCPEEEQMRWEERASKLWRWENIFLIHLSFYDKLF